ncbi:MAG: DUF29 domain-containing protein [Gomphosphaeria aponina SAG 52.96 = DSM 107014]|uniref:DUF29 domain-containing protein n=1 Tax=Gomphosphaeria aponina SAG 52.96 = DSM 107014 TaxID=1521640 RepID=A0A941GX30_9CHRO|nr:DUF29 domain-containing protein [Gomphosphaeria aponina SAG 52.96 = DSM 107014]
MVTTAKEKIQQIYTEDFLLWVDTTSEQIQQRDVENLDWEHILEEIVALGNEQRHKVESYLLRLFIHLLLYKYWETERTWSGKGWEKEIDNFRIELELLLESKNLYNHFLGQMDSIYLKARKNAIRKSKLAPEIFPESSPFSVEELLDFGFLPETK